MASIAIVTLLAMPTAAIAVDGKAAEHLRHYLECLRWLVTDPAMHAANCTPGRPFEFPEQHGGDGTPFIIRIISPSAWSDSAPSSSSTEEPSESSSSEEEPTEEPSSDEESSESESEEVPSESQPSESCEGTDCFPP